MTTLGPLAVTVTGGSFGALEKAVNSEDQSGSIDSWDNLIVSGWIADPTDGSPMSDVKVLIDGVSVGAPALGIARPDIAASYGDPAFARSGFSLTYPGASLAAGSSYGGRRRSQLPLVSTTLGPVTITAGRPLGIWTRPSTMPPAPRQCRSRRMYCQRLDRRSHRWLSDGQRKGVDRR